MRVIRSIACDFPGVMSWSMVWEGCVLKPLSRATRSVLPSDRDHTSPSALEGFRPEMRAFTDKADMGCVVVVRVVQNDQQSSSKAEAHGRRIRERTSSIKNTLSVTA